MERDGGAPADGLNRAAARTRGRCRMYFVNLTDDTLVGGYCLPIRKLNPSRRPTCRQERVERPVAKYARAESHPEQARRRTASRSGAADSRISAAFRLKFAHLGENRVSF